MAHSITSKLRGMLTAAVALVAALLLVPGTAFAAAAEDQGSLTITGLNSGDTADIYQIVQYDYDTTSNTYDWSFVSPFGTGIQKSDYESANASQLRTYAQTFAGQIGGANAVDTDVTAAELKDGYDLGIGQYLVIVHAVADSNRTYENIIVDIAPVAGNYPDFDWSAGDHNVDVTVDQKYSTGSTVTKSDGDAIDANKDGYAVGDTVPFIIDAEIPSLPSTLYGEPFTIVDTMSNGLDFVVNDDNPQNSVTVEVQDSNQQRVGTLNYTLVTPSEGWAYGDADFAVEFDYNDIVTNHWNNGGFHVVIKYNATINDDAVVMDAETNDATLEYGDNYKANAPTVEVEIYTLKVTKTDASDPAKTLEGASFEIYRVDSSSPDTIPGTQQNGYRLQSSTGDYTFTSGEDGTFTVEGLEPGDYVLIETAAPKGYQVDRTPHTVSITKDSPSTTAVTTSIVNSKTSLPELPTTGGMGTIVFTAVGVVIIAGAVAFIVKSRKQNN